MPTPAASSLGCHAYANGQTGFSGAALRLYQRLDRLFLSWAAQVDAEEYLFPAALPARELARLDYFRSFPHLITFPIVLDGDADNLAAFAEGEPLRDGAVQLARTAPVDSVLTPAPCYHFYTTFQATTLQRPLYLTTRASCFRREANYAPLERQWNFTMREIVCIGGEADVRAFLARCRETVHGFARHIGLAAEWTNAADPFFDPMRNPRFIAQRVEPLKHELCIDSGLAISSVNFHRTYFGSAFDIRYGDDAAFTGCIGFGMERWIHAIVDRFGSDERGWPIPH